MGAADSSVSLTGGRGRSQNTRLRLQAVSAVVGEGRKERQTVAGICANSSFLPTFPPAAFPQTLVVQTLGLSVDGHSSN